jgi:putative adenylate-forming enzyme
MKTKRWQLIKAYTRAKWHQRFGCSRDWQDRQVTRHLERVIGKSSWYRRKFSGLEIGDWREWPTIDKAEMMENFDELNTVGVSKRDALELARRSEESRDFSPQIGDITVGLSSGTTGNTGIFLANSGERAAWAGNLLAKVLPYSLLHRQKVALFLRANSSLYESTKSRTIQFRFFDLLASIETHLQRWNEYQPDVVVAPPSMLRLLAERLKEGTLNHIPEKIVSAAEKLDILDEALIGEAFGQRVHQVYQCTEGFLATTCQHGTLHINEDIVVIQKDYLDRNSGRFSPIITDFRRISQPIIRYRLDDILIERQEPCPCGSTWLALEQIEGRCDDLCFLQSANDSQNHIAVFPDFLRRSVIAASPNITDYSVRQMDKDTFAIALGGESGPEAQEQVRQQINRRAQSLGARQPVIRFEDMPLRKAGAKKRRVLRECPLPDRLS